MRRKLVVLTILSLLIAAAPAANAAPDAKPAAVLKVEGKVAMIPATQPAAAPAVPKATPAAEAPKAAGEQSWWQSLLVDLLIAALAIFVPVISALGFLLLRKLGIKVDLATLDSLAGKAALYAEKKASTALGEGKPKSTGAQKEEWAFDLIRSVDAKLMGSEKAKEKLRALILAKIPEAESAMAVAAPAVPKATPAAEAAAEKRGREAEIRDIAEKVAMFPATQPAAAPAKKEG
jgi:hypothetical protein